jgi:hypothetical protein
MWLKGWVTPLSLEIRDQKLEIGDCLLIPNVDKPQPQGTQSCTEFYKDAQNHLIILVTPHPIPLTPLPLLGEGGTREFFGVFCAVYGAKHTKKLLFRPLSLWERGGGRAEQLLILSESR